MLKTTRLFALLFVVLVSLGLAACTANKVTASGAPRSLQDRYTSLDQALRTLPNVQVTGETVMYRGVTSLQGDQEMRFVADGRLLGTYAQAASLVPLADIRALRVMQPTEASERYGFQGAGGIIELLLME